ncbi:MAG: DUF2207 domain-containing protein [Candidatus Moranbacteria bacterium]|nr:DUF2207 domain-containing protein [Candidatus Moranbacteria bacterium]
MKKVVINLAVILSFFWFGFSAQAQTSVDTISQEQVDNFAGKIVINTDASIEVTEKIDYNFGALEKHGIFRDVTVKYKARGGNYNLRLTDVSVADENGIPYAFTTSYTGADFEIKIGDVNKLISGEKVYVIHYKIQRAINYFTDHDELYWNLTGDKWLVPIKNASLEIQLPQQIETDKLQIECFQGVYGSASECGKDFLKNGNFSYKSSGEIIPGQGLTAVAGFPKGIIKEPGIIQKFWETFKDNGILLLPILILGLLVWLWHSRGRDPKGRGTIIAEFDAPDNLTPMEVGTVADEKFDKKDFSAEIIFLAVKGYLKIKKVDNKILFLTSIDYELEKLKDESNLENTEDKAILQNLFASGNKVAISSLKDSFYKKFKEIGDQVYAKLANSGYFIQNPDKVRKNYLILGIVILFLGFPLGAFFGGLGIFSFIVSGILIIIFSFFMPQRSIKGVLAKEHILGLKEYLTVAEKDRIKFHNAPAKNPEHFEKLLPYAMVLGVEKEWAKQFEDIYKNSPSWYEDSHGGSFNSVLFVSNLNSFSASANSSLTSAPSSASGGGSGFSGGGAGGGFGGGGGGSW